MNIFITRSTSDHNWSRPLCFMSFAEARSRKNPDPICTNNRKIRNEKFTPGENSLLPCKKLYKSKWYEKPIAAFPHIGDNIDTWHYILWKI